MQHFWNDVTYKTISQYEHVIALWTGPKEFIIFNLYTKILFAGQLRIYIWDISRQICIPKPWPFFIYMNSHIRARATYARLRIHM